MIGVRRGSVWIELSAAEISMLAAIPEWLGDVGSDPTDPAGPRLFQSAYPDDPMASAEYEVEYGVTLDETRSKDRKVFAKTLTRAEKGVALKEKEAESWLRVVGDVRLALAARLGIDDNRWESRATRTPQVDLVHYLTHLQSGLIDALDVLMEE